MMVLKVRGKDYKVKFGFNSFADSDLLDRVQDVGTLLNGAGAETDADVVGMGKIRELFCVVRELIFEGLQKYHASDFESVQDVGNLLDIYFDETPEAKEGEEQENRGVLALFIQLGNELTSEGFLANFLQTMASVEKDSIAAIPQDHKKSTKRTTKIK